ncbi:uncharacterized protein PG998_005681 [Apiospora kogelbergensis]|uniref:uncharacterized protein n=1 Tax=Apiospora kogelbergensis TaxID=1337665 RepID=UPI00312FFB94
MGYATDHTLPASRPACSGTIAPAVELRSESRPYASTAVTRGQAFRMPAPDGGAPDEVEDEHIAPPVDGKASALPVHRREQVCRQIVHEARVVVVGDEAGHPRC